MIKGAEKQLTGLGFNATVKDELIVRIQGSFKRVIKIIFLTNKFSKMDIFKREPSKLGLRFTSSKGVLSTRATLEFKVKKI